MARGDDGRRAGDKAPRAGGQEIPESDKALRIGSAHGDQTLEEDATGYARDIGPQGNMGGPDPASRVQNAGLGKTRGQHPSRSLELRKRGYGIGGGYERPYRKERTQPRDSSKELYGPLPHAGYYGAGTSVRPFKVGQAGFGDELTWYRSQYGENTSGYEKKKKR
jgi:hypothetical protein